MGFNFTQVGEGLPLPSGSVDAVIGTLVLCSVFDVSSTLKGDMYFLPPEEVFSCLLLSNLLWRRSLLATSEVNKVFSIMLLGKLLIGYTSWVSEIESNAETCGTVAARTEVQRVLRPGGMFLFVEHVAAPGKLLNTHA